MPRFRTTVEAQTHPEWSAQPLAIYAPQANQRRLIDISDAARGAGLRLGMAVKEAAQRCPQGIYVPDDPPRYTRAFAAVLDVLDHFSPVVEDAGVGLAFADAAGLGPLYGPDAALGARVRRDVATATGHTADIGLATGRLAAEVAARTAGVEGVTVVATSDRTYLAEQPVERLPLNERTLASLETLGIASIGAFADLPANAVRTRYGVAGARAWRLARGEDPQPLRGRTRPLVLHETVDFEWEEHNVDRLAFALQGPGRSAWPSAWPSGTRWRSRSEAGSSAPTARSSSLRCRCPSRPSRPPPFATRPAGVSRRGPTPRRPPRSCRRCHPTGPAWCA